MLSLILNIYADKATVYCKCDQASDLWQKLESAAELKFNLGDTVDWGRKWLVGFNDAKTQPVSSKWSNNTDAIDVKIWEESAPEKKTSFKMMMLPFCSKLDWGSYILSIAKTAS